MKYYHFIKTILYVDEIANQDPIIKSMNNSNYNIIPLLSRYFKNRFNLIIQDPTKVAVNQFTLKADFDNYNNKFIYSLNYLMDINDTDEDFIIKERHINQEEFDMIKRKCFALKNAGILIEHTVYLERC